MLIQCENCKTKYMVSSKTIGDSGRPVKCVKCGHTWFVKPSQDDMQAAKKVEESNVKFNNYRGRTHLPTVKEDVPLLIQVLPIILIIFLFAATMIYYKDTIKRIPGIKNLYQTIDIFNTEDVILEDVIVKKIKSETSTSLLFKGNIINNSFEERTLPNLKVTIISRTGEKLLTHTFVTNNKILQPGERFPFENKVKGVQSWAELLVLDIGNKIELFIR